MKTLTVFTPTYNRENFLLRLYKSLVTQNASDYFEWLIVDDGSTDNTEDLIKSFASEKLIDIRYIKKENGGKPSAFNVGIENADSKLFICVDSDDWLTDNAVSCIKNREREVLDNTKICGFAGRCVNTDGAPIEGACKKEFISNTMVIRDKYKGKDKPEIIKTEILKKYRFPIFENEKFITEAYVFDRLTSDYPFLYTNDLIMGKEYLLGGLTDETLGLRIRNIRGTIAYYEQRVRLTRGIKGKIKAKINLNRFLLHSGKKSRYALYHFIAVLMYRRDKKSLKKT